MPSHSDIYFNSAETEMMYHRDLFPLKRSINQKLYTLFEEVKNRLKDTAIHREFNFPPGMNLETGKISQGENHQQFPWVVLDFPKLFQQENIFAFRTLFWFGSGFSNSLIVGGSSAQAFFTSFTRNISNLHNRNIYFSMHEDPWDHDVTGNHSIKIEQLNVTAIKSHIEQHHFFKLSNAFQFDEGNRIIEACAENYTLFLSALQSP